MAKHYLVTVVLLACAANIPFSIGGAAISLYETISEIKGRLLTSEEGCGFSIAEQQKQKRIIGGGPAENGK